MLLTVSDVALRALVNKPIWGAAEMSDFLLALSIAAGFFVANNNRGHITVDLFHGLLRRILGTAYGGFVTVTETLGVLLYAGILGLFAYEAYESSEATVVLEWPISPIFAVVALLLLLSAIYFIWPFHADRENQE